MNMIKLDLLLFTFHGLCVNYNTVLHGKIQQGNMEHWPQNYT